MKIYFVRHGKPSPADIDPAKGLSESGKAEIIRLAESIRHLNIEVAEIYHSGKARAEQTAMILSQMVKSERGVNQKNGLNPNDPVEPIVTEIKAREQSLIFVGHLPFMARLASVMLINDDHQNLMEWSTGSMACIECDGDKCALQWFINPDIIIADISGQFSSYH